ncbi:hypothetical protein M0805_009777 [Coniferiporia weirii]|nr:hypothetical protein M0805_009777 [Coniferiporia weirii]
MNTSGSPSLAERPAHSTVNRSTSELSSDATASDLPGPGRLLGRLYSSLGKGLEGRIGSLADRINRGRRGSAVEAPDIALTVQSTRRGPSSTASHSNSANWRAVFSFSTVSSDETATNLPGPGRLLGKLYSKGGRILENRLNKIANEAGRGPDACAARIKSALLGEPYPDEMLVYLWAKADANDNSTLLPQELILFRECRQLIQYAYSQLPATHNCAMRHIAKFAVEDRYMYTLFNALGTLNHLTEIRKRELKRLNYDSDWSIPHCRKALICLSNNEVNTVLHRHLRLGENAGDQPLPFLCQTLMKFLRDPELSFLALRYIARILGRWRPPALSFDLYIDCLVGLADLTYSLPHIVDWECVDDIYSRAFECYVPVVHHDGAILDSNVLKWRKIYSVTFGNAHRFPASINFLNTATRVDELLDKNNPRNIRVNQTRASGDAIFPDNFALSQNLLLTAAVFPSQILDIQASSERPRDEIPTSRYDGLPKLVSAYVHTELSTTLWRNLSIGPDVVTSEILREHISRFKSPIGGLYLHLRSVPKRFTLKNLCRRLVGFLANPNPDIASRALLRTEFIIQQNRYCRIAIAEALSELLAQPGGLGFESESESGSMLESALDAVHNLLDAAQAHNVDVDVDDLSKGSFKSEHIFRHRARDGRTHLRHEQFRRENPCELCLSRGTWEDPRDVAVATRLNEVFSCAPQQLMVLEVPAGMGFGAAGHVPILAGVNFAGEREYIACAQYDSVTGTVRGAWTTVVDGARNVVYEDWDEREDGDGDGGGKGVGVHTTQSFWVLVSRFDVDANGETEAQTRAATGGLDVTGQCHWRAGKASLHILDKAEGDRVYARNRGVLEPESEPESDLEAQSLDEFE